MSVTIFEISQIPSPVGNIVKLLSQPRLNAAAVAGVQAKMFDNLGACALDTDRYDHGTADCTQLRRVHDTQITGLK